MLIASIALAAILVVSGTDIAVRLQTPVSSNTSKSGDKVEAVVITPVLRDGLVALPAGLKLTGTVTEAKPSLKPDERGSLWLQFIALLPPGTNPVAVKTRVVSVDNAREKVDEQGRIVGIVASETLAARLDAGIEKVTEKNSRLGSFLGIARSAMISKEGPSGEIRYEPGVELMLKITEDLTWPAAPEPYEIATFADLNALEKMVNSQPYRTMAEKPPKPSDMTNLMFIATEQALNDTFTAAGWTTAHKLNAESALETMRAIAQMRGYKEAPMSRLLLDGQGSVFDFQKGLNTFEKRHHLRIWRRPVTIEGKPVWVCAATHDIGIEFSQQNRTFIHLIDGEIDKERAKVVTDLLFTGRVKALALVDRPEVPRTLQNATGDNVTTDGRMAVLVLE
jgi:hypothetical protein